MLWVFSKVPRRIHVISQGVLLRGLLDVAALRPWTLRTSAPTRLWELRWEDLEPLLRVYPALRTQAMTVRGHVSRSHRMAVLRIEVGLGAYSCVAHEPRPPSCCKTGSSPNHPLLTVRPAVFPRPPHLGAEWRARQGRVLVRCAALPCGSDGEAAPLPERLAVCEPRWCGPAGAKWWRCCCECSSSPRCWTRLRTTWMRCSG
jgi:hypothetical protein